MSLRRLLGALAWALLCALMLAPARAQTPIVGLTADGWVTVCTAPCRVVTLGGPARLVSDTVAPSNATIDAGTILASDQGQGQGLTFGVPGQTVYGRGMNTGTRVAVVPYGGDGGAGASSAASSGPGGLSSFSRIPSSTASSNLTTAKSSAGRAYTYQGCNTTASTVYLRLYNAASAGAVTVGTTTPYAGPYAFPANTCAPPTAFAPPFGIYAGSGITYAFGTAPSDTDTTTIGSGAITGFQLGFQ